MKQAYISAIGVILSATIGGLVAYWVAWLKTKSDKDAFEKNLALQVERFTHDVRNLTSGRKIEIAYKYAELAAKKSETAQEFMSQIAKETAIGFLYFDDEDSKPKIWIRNDSNILIGRHPGCDVCIADLAVSRQHCVLHTIENNAFLVPLRPTNPLFVNGKGISERTLLKNGDLLTIGETELEFVLL